MPIEEAAELARRAIYHATHRDGASGGCVSGMHSLSESISIWFRLSCITVYLCRLVSYKTNHFLSLQQ
jgi:hypothetical protein